MFSSKSKDIPAPAPQAAPQGQKRAARAHVPSIISADLAVKGTLTSSGDIQIDGKVEGDVRSAGLVIGEQAEIRGEIHADDVTVRGKVIGRIRARKILLASTCHVEGDILHEAFAVEAGAFFEGNCRHSDTPLDTAPAEVPPLADAPPEPAPLRAAGARGAVMPTATLTPLGRAG